MQGGTKNVSHTSNIYKPTLHVARRTGTGTDRKEKTGKSALRC